MNDTRSMGQVLREVGASVVGIKMPMGVPYGPSLIDSLLAATVSSNLTGLCAHFIVRHQGGVRGLTTSWVRFLGLSQVTFR